jgi:TonB family protein
MIILVAGAGLLLYRFAFNKQKNEVAKLENKKAEVPVSKDTSTKSSVTLTEGTVPWKEKQVTNNPKQNTAKTGPHKIIATNNNGLSSSSTLFDSTGHEFARTNTNSVAAVPGKPVPESRNLNSGTVSERDQKKVTDDIAKEEFKKTAGKRKDSDGDGIGDKFDRQPAEGAYKINKSVVNNKPDQIQQRDNYFRGRVTDLNNNPVPFANVTNTEDNAGTYADAKGYFNLISPDSVLNVQVRSVGFNNNNIQLKNNLATNQVIMQEDKSLNEVVLSNKKPNATARSHDDNMKLEEPEPADGWDNYDAYLVNNLNVPDEIKTKKTGGEVEISFEVDKNGDPVRIKVEKSLCSKCDTEAIRLIKQGPKWKRKAKNGRATVTVPFLNPLP